MRSLTRIQWAAAAAATTACLWLHWQFFRHAGPLWRDESACVELSARLPWTSLWSGTGKDFFPALYFFLLRIWGAAAGASDQALRVPGLVIGLASVSLLWLHARWAGAGVPLVSLLLFGMNPLAVRSLDYLRPYGLGVLCLLAFSALLLRLALKPTTGRAAAAAAAAAVGLRCFYQLAFFILALCLSAIAVAALRRDRRGAALSLAVGFAAAISLLPELQAIAAVRQEGLIARSAGNFSSVWGAFRNSFGTPRLSCLWLWWGGAAAGVIRALRAREARRVYHAFALIAAVPLTFLYLKASGMVVQSHYFMPLMAFMAACLDGLWGDSPAALAVCALFLLFPEARAQLKARQTDIDLIAAEIEREAAPKDLVVVNPWYYGVSFRRYYRGKAPWLTVPPLPMGDDFKIEAYKPVERVMSRRAVLDPVLSEIARTLKSGRRLWVIGALDYRPPTGAPPSGLYVGPYYAYWSAVVGSFVAAHARSLERRTSFSEGPVNHLENPSLDLVEGWRNR